MPFFLLFVWMNFRSPIIKVRKNSSTNANGCIPRKLVAVEQLKNVKRWKKKYGYGMQWVAESAVSSIKRTFGEYVMSLKWENTIKELSKSVPL
jgi:predicted rRNA methylase YqxC with S4 and FtsJ domains